MSARCLAGIAAGLFLAPALLAQATPVSAGADREYARMAREGAPEHISADAAVARFEGGRFVELQSGTNGFTCTLLPDPGNPPVCGDANAMQWLTAAFTQQPSPGISAPGIAYMAKGGSHYETEDGGFAMGAGPGNRLVEESPHWMVLWPFDSTTGLPTHSAAETYVMWAGSPYAHLMIHQDPRRLRPDR